MKSFLNKTTAIALGLLVGACGHGPGALNVKPKQEPVYNFTQSSQVLECVGAKVDRTQTTPIDVYISDIPDHTTPSIEGGFLTKNAVMMVTTALDRLDTDKVAVIGRNGAMRSRRQVQMLGSFTELNRTTKSNALSGQAIIPGGFELEVGGDNNFNHIALDLALSEQNRIIPKTATSVSVQIKGNSGDVTLTYDEGDDFAAIGALGFSAQEGFHSSQRLLIETAVALMMSKYFQIDIKDCLQSTAKTDKVPIASDYDTPVFPEAAMKAEPKPVATAPAPVAAPAYTPAPTTTNQPVYLRRGEYETRAYTPPTPLAPQPQPETFYQEEPTALPETNGVVVLPRNSNARFLRAQPPEYQQNNNADFSGVPSTNVQNPAADNEPEFYKQQSREKLEWGYRP